MATAASGIDTTPVGLDEAISIELAEADAWEDLYAACPAELAARAGVGSERMGGALVLRWAASGRRYFSRAIGLGVAEPAGGAAIDEILDGYRRAGIEMFLLQSLPQCRPDGYDQLLRERGLAPFDRQDRIVRDGRPLAMPAGDGRYRVERVSAGAAEEWSQFLQRVYRLDTGRWLHGLVDRPGWHQYVAREQGRIVAARGMRISNDGTVWMGMDGPVPGVHWADYRPDAALCPAMVTAALELRARRFVTDIELHADGMDTPAYGMFAELGFTRPYVRTHWAPAA